MPRTFVALVAVVACLVWLAGGPATASAQDASPQASPTAGPCDAPELPPGTPTPQEEIDAAMASPVGDTAGMEGTPDPAAAGAAVATEAAMEATPEAMATPAGTPADQETADRVAAAVENVHNCYNAGDFLAVAALFTANGLLEEFGTPNPYDVPLFLEGGPPIAVDSVGDVQVHDDGRLSADVVSRFGQQVAHERWYLVEEGGYLLVDGTPDLPVEPPAGADVATVEVTMTDFAFELSEETVAAADYVVLGGPNAGQYLHEIVVVKFPEGVEFSMEMIEMPEPPEGTEFLGASAGPPGAEVELVLADLEPGVYTLICFVDEPDGVPHAAKGMVATLTVQ